MDLPPKSFGIAIQDGLEHELSVWFHDNPCRVNEPDEVGEYPLDTAVRMLRPELCEQLINLGANVNFVDASGSSAIHSVIEAFEEDPNGLGAIVAPKIIELLLSRGVNPNLRGYNDFSPLHLACVKGATSIAKMLLNWGASPTLVAEEYLEGGRTPIEVARFYNRQEIVDLLESVIPKAQLLARETQLRKLRTRRI